MPSSPLLRFARVVIPASIFLASLLLFVLEPMVAKRLLPTYGGSAAVWSTCLVFYQFDLLLGYGYAAWLTRKRARNPRLQSVIHAALLLFSLFLLPIGSRAAIDQPGGSSPFTQIWWQLAAGIGLPFALLAATSPALQSWAGRTGLPTPYRLYALSNVASLVALMAYPVLIESRLSTASQLQAWSWMYGLFVLLSLTAAFLNARLRPATRPVSETRYELPTRWILPGAWAFCSSVLLLAITNHMTQNIAAVPLLWILPLATYLFTFSLAFSGLVPVGRALGLRLLAFALGTLAFLVYDVHAVEAIQVSIPILIAGLLICCYFCHSELFRIRPAAESLGAFYLAIAAGSAAGAIAVGILAPLVFRGVYELPLALVLLAGLTLYTIWRESEWPLRALALGVCACMIATVVANIRAYRAGTISMRRSFYGALRVVQTNPGPNAQRTLYHGTIEHGSQYLLPPRRQRAGTYYSPESGAGIVLREFPKTGKRVGIVGLGAGTLAAYGQPGDSYRFFEINQQVLDLAATLFTYLRESPARITTTIGDGRLALQHDTDELFDVLILDAFSGDAIPVHLLTREAFAIYRQHLQPRGALLVHVSNDFLDLPPVAARLAQDAGWTGMLVHNKSDVEQDWLPADWMVITGNPDLFSGTSLRQHAQPVPVESDVPLWTDDRNDLLRVLRKPALR